MKLSKKIADGLRSFANWFDPPQKTKTELAKEEDPLATPTPTPLPDSIDWGPDACPRCTKEKRCPRHTHGKANEYKIHDTSKSCAECQQIRKTDPTKSCLKHTIFGY